ncbi:MAG: hypothetical protein MCM46_00170 [Candidatus Manganitrophus sp. SB1]|nr:hypothetical protein [Candidatus Manganitrophus morganii]
MKRWGIFLLLLLSLPSVRAEARETSGKRTCFGLIWCTEEKDGSVSRDALYLYSSEQREGFSRLSVRPFYSHEIDLKADYVRRSILWPLGTYEKKGNDIWFHVFPLYWHEEHPRERFTLFFPLYFNYLKDENSYFHLFPLYGHHARGESYDRYFVLGPLFIYTQDLERERRQWDFLFPLVSHRSDREGSATRVLPLYFSEYDHTSGQAYRYLLPIYGAWESPAFSHSFLFPLYGSEEDKKASERRLSLLGLPPIRALRPLPTLALYEHVSASDRTTDRFFPIYRYARWFNEDRTEIDALFLYRHQSSPGGVLDRLFPLYRYEQSQQNTHLSLVGYQELSLFWYQRTPQEVKSHLFPLYNKESDSRSDANQLGLIGYGPLSLYRHERTALGMTDRLFPLYSYKEQKEGIDFSLLGVGPLAFYRHQQRADGTRDRFFPLYDYESVGAQRALSLLGVSELALYRQEITPSQVRHRLFPLYAYHRDLLKDKTEIDGLLLYRHQTSPSATSDRLFPLYGYRRSGKSVRFSLLGFPPTGNDWTLSLYEHAESPSLIEDRLFPLYRYRHHLVNGERQWDALFVYQHRQSETFTKDALLPFHSYEHDILRQERRMGLLGVPPLMLFESRSTPAESTGHLFPLYGYRKRPEERRITLLGLPPIGDTSLSLYEHRTSEGEVVDRFFPLYRYAHNLKRDEIDFNLLLFYQHHETPQRTDDFLFPLGNLTREGTKTDLSVIGYGPLSLFRYINDGTALTHRFFPLYYSRSRLEGEETFLNALLIYTHRATPKALYDGLFPLYSYERVAGKSALSIVGFSELSLYRHTGSKEKTTDRLFPLYGYEQEKGNGGWSFGMIGVPPLSLYAHKSSPASVEDRFFPLYDYERREDRFAVSFVGLRDLSLYRHEQTASLTRDRLFPLYDYRSDAVAGSRSFGLLGVSSLTLYSHRSTAREVDDRLFPLYGYREDRTDGAWRLSALGLPPIGSGPALALYEHSDSEKELTDRFLPFYLYQHDLEKKERRFTTLLSRYRSNPDGRWQRVFPFYSDERDHKTGVRRVGVIGVAPFSLYQRVQTNEELSDRFFPLYRYSYNRIRDEGELSLLWPLVTYKNREGHTTEASVLWWLVNYERSDEETQEWHLLGGSAMAVVSRSVSPERSTFEFNPILPLYSYEKERGKGVEWTFLGGLVGVERSDEGARKMRWLWFFGGADDTRTKEEGDLTL